MQLRLPCPHWGLDFVVGVQNQLVGLGIAIELNTSPLMIHDSGIGFHHVILKSSVHRVEGFIEFAQIVDWILIIFSQVLRSVFKVFFRILGPAGSDGQEESENKKSSFFIF